MTRSPVLYTQIVGRALRLAPGKTRATIIDLTTSCQTLYTLDDLMEGVFTQEEVEVKLAGKERSTRAGVDPTEYTTRLVDLLGATELAWYSNAGRNVMPLQSGYALLVTPSGEGARAYFESQLALARAGKSQAVAEQVEWQLAHYDQCVLFHLTTPQA
jgi:superfamily II DNA or RNA helicase